MKPLKKGATYDDLVRVPEHYVAEMFDAESIDRGKRLRIYAREGVGHAWLVDPLRQTLEVLALEAGSLAQIEEHRGEGSVRALPFDAIELDLRALWR